MADSIGVTGTREEPTEAQVTTLACELQDLTSPGVEFHHGDCVGADREAHILAMTLGYTVTVHPPIDPKHRAFLTGHHAFEPTGFGVRNARIVRLSRLLLALPLGPEAQHPRSGTWQTVRIARKLGREIRIIRPDGSVDVEPARVRPVLLRGV